MSGQGTASSRLDVSDLLSIGGLLDPTGIASLGANVEISGGGTVLAQRLGLGDPSAEHSATLTISGVGGNGQASLLNVVGADATLLVAGAPGGTLLEVADGGMLSSGSGSTGDSIGDGSLAGTVLIHGNSGSQPATWSTTAGFTHIGSEGAPSELIVQEGGVVTADLGISFSPRLSSAGQGDNLGQRFLAHCWPNVFRPRR